MDVFSLCWGLQSSLSVKTKWPKAPTLQLSREAAGDDFLLARVQQRVVGQVWEVHPLDEGSRATSSNTAHAMLAMNAPGTKDCDQSVVVCSAESVVRTFSARSW